MTFPAGPQTGQPPAQQGSGQQGQGSAGTGDQQQGQQNSGQPPGQQGQQVPSLLDTVAQQAAQQGGQHGAGQQQNTGQGAGQQGGAPNVDELVSQLEQRLAARFDAVADRRVNALLNEIRGQGAGQQQGGQQAGSQQQNSGQQGGQQTEQTRDQHGRFATGPDPMAVREARLAFRDYIGDRVQFVSAIEREWVMDAGGSLVQARITPGADPDAVAREVAITVADRTRALRQHYEEQILTALKARGVDVTGSGRGAASLPQGVPAATDRTEAARQAARTLAQTVNTERGWQPQQPASQ